MGFFKKGLCRRTFNSVNISCQIRDIVLAQHFLCEQVLIIFN